MSRPERNYVLKIKIQFEMHIILQLDQGERQLKKVERKNDYLVQSALILAKGLTLLEGNVAWLYPQALELNDIFSAENLPYFRGRTSLK